MKVLIIDNYDSFTFNLYQQIGCIIAGGVNKKEADEKIRVIRNDKTSIKDVLKINPSHIVLSPGPGEPSDKKYFGICDAIIRDVGPYVPVLGICLGMQGMASVFGGRIRKANIPAHGKTSIIHHDGRGIFYRLRRDFVAMRYHSLTVDRDELPTCLECSAFTQDENEEIVMGLRHRHYPIEGVQFHPESFASEEGMNLFSNFLYGSENIYETKVI